MVTWYSDHMGADGDNDTSLASPPTIVSAGVAHGRLRYKRAYFEGMPLTTEVVRMFSLRSSDRLFELLVSTTGTDSAGTTDIGVYLSGTNHDGVLVDINLFSDALDISTAALDRTDALVQATSAAGTDRGKQMWELCALTDGTDTTDPDILYDVCLTIDTSCATADTIITLEAYYTSGD